MTANNSSSHEIVMETLRSVRTLLGMEGRSPESGFS